MPWSHFVQNYDPTYKRCENGGLRPAPKEKIEYILEGNLKNLSVWIFQSLSVWKGVQSV